MIKHTKTFINDVQPIFEENFGISSISEKLGLLQKHLDKIGNNDAKARAEARPIAEALFKDISDSFPRIGETLFSEDNKRWQAWINQAPSSPAESEDEA